MEYTIEKSKEEAEKIKSIQEILMELDGDYLSSALKDMRENHDLREDMVLFNPNPSTHYEQQALNEAKQNQFALILKLKENMLVIARAQGELMRAKGHENEMKNIFENL